MKKYIVILVCLLATVVAGAKETEPLKISRVVEQSFIREFGTRTDVSWHMVQDISVATYFEDGRKKEVYYFSNGEVLGIGTELSDQLLPKSIMDRITKLFHSPLIETVYEFRTADQPTRFYVRLATSRHSMIVSANEFGDLRVDSKEKLNNPG